MSRKRYVDTQQSHVPLILALIFMGVLVGGFIYYSNKSAQTVKEPVLMDFIPKQSEVLSSEKAKDEPYTIEKKSRKEKNTEFAISINYPFLNHGNTSVESVNTHVTDYIDSMVKKFKDDFYQAKKDGINMPDGASWSLAITYDVPFQSQELMSLVMHVDSYTGGAHPNNEIKTFVTDLKEEKILSIDDVLLSDASFKILSDKVMSELISRDISDADWIQTGAGAEKKNYQAWYFSPSGLTVAFPPYQVAAYAAGKQEVKFLFSQLSSILKQDYILVR